MAGAAEGAHSWWPLAGNVYAWSLLLQRLLVDGHVMQWCDSCCSADAGKETAALVSINERQSNDCLLGQMQLPGGDMMAVGLPT